MKDKREGSPEQEVCPGSPEKGRMEMDDLFLRVKTEMKEEIEDDMRMSG